LEGFNFELIEKDNLTPKLKDNVLTFSPFTNISSILSLLEENKNKLHFRYIIEKWNDDHLKKRRKMLELITNLIGAKTIYISPRLIKEKNVSNPWPI